MSQIASCTHSRYRNIINAWTGGRVIVLTLTEVLEMGARGLRLGWGGVVGGGKGNGEEQLNCNQIWAQSAQKPAIQIQEVQPRSTFHCTFFNHKVLTDIASYLADSKQFQSLL